MRGIVWFRRDLRFADQPALTAVCEECNEIIPPLCVRRTSVAIPCLRRCVQVRTFRDHVIFEADEVQGATGAPLQRYSDLDLAKLQVSQ